MTSNSSPSLISSRRFSQILKAPFRSTFKKKPNGRRDVEDDSKPNTPKAGILKDLASQGRRIPQDFQLLLEMLEMHEQGGYEDDSRYTVRLLPGYPPLIMI